MGVPLGQSPRPSGVAQSCPTVWRLRGTHRPLLVVQLGQFDPLHLQVTPQSLRQSLWLTLDAPFMLIKDHPAPGRKLKVLSHPLGPGCPEWSIVAVVDGVGCRRRGWRQHAGHPAAGKAIAFDVPESASPAVLQEVAHVIPDHNVIGAGEPLVVEGFEAPLDRSPCRR
jgi:hypothetical protein